MVFLAKNSTRSLCTALVIIPHLRGWAYSYFASSIGDTTIVRISRNYSLAFVRKGDVDALTGRVIPRAINTTLFRYYWKSVCSVQCKTRGIGISTACNLWCHRSRRSPWLWYSTNLEILLLGSWHMTKLLLTLNIYLIRYLESDTIVILLTSNPSYKQPFSSLYQSLNYSMANAATMQPPSIGVISSFKSPLLQLANWQCPR